MTKLLLKIIGFIFVGLAIIGVFLPLLPTTPFLLISAACFAKSSPNLYNQLINNKIFGPLIINWQTSRSIPKKAKIISLLMMCLATIWSCYLLQYSSFLQLLVITLILPPMFFVFRLPNS